VNEFIIHVLNPYIKRYFIKSILQPLVLFDFTYLLISVDLVIYKLVH